MLEATAQLRLQPDMPICQTDYPLDWYQKEFLPYAESYQHLPDRNLETVLKWMQPQVEKALQALGNKTLLLAHYYMGGTIVKLIEHFNGYVGDSYQLAMIAKRHPEKTLLIESAVHFMAETISILASPEQRVYITNPKSGCTMEMQAKDYMVEPAYTELNQRYGTDNIIPICYMNTSGRLKALTGKQNGAVCTSSNVKKIFQWALAQNKKILFVPDQFMGENVAGWVGIPPEKIAYWPGGNAGAQFSLANQDPKSVERFDQAQLILFQSFCGVHSFYNADMVHFWQQQKYNVVVHPECRKQTVDAANECGSTAFIWDWVTHDRAGTGAYAVGTENHMVENLKQVARQQGIAVVNVADANLPGKSSLGCGCATMSRNDPPHLVAVLDLLSQGAELDANQVQAGDVVNEFSGARQRLTVDQQTQLKFDAQVALENMIRITES